MNNRFFLLVLLFVMAFLIGCVGAPGVAGAPGVTGAPGVAGAPGLPGVQRVGGARRVGDAFQFGVNESSPSGIATIGNILYMFGNASQILYMLDLSTGRARVSGYLTFSDIPIYMIAYDLASVRNTLYISFWSGLYMIDAETGIATRVGDTVQNGVLTDEGETVAANNISGVGDILYMIGFSNISGGQFLYTIDTETGIASKVNIDFSDIYGVTTMASLGNTLYLTSGVDILYRLDTETGETEQVGNVPRGFGVYEWQPASMAFHNDNLYMVGSSGAGLYKLRYE